MDFRKSALYFLGNVLFFREEENLLIFNLIFQHFINNEILTGDLSPVAIESFLEQKKNMLGLR